MQIIGISGQAGSGKSTAAAALVAHHGFVEIGLADPLKRICREVFEFTDEQLWGPSECRNAIDARYPRKTRGWGAHWTHLTPRHALQTLGTNWGRECFNDIWVHIAIRNATTVLTKDRVEYSSRFGVRSVDDSDNPTYHPPPRAAGVTIPDVRFDNERVAIHAAGGRVIRIVRASAGLSGAAAAHASETEQAGIPDSAFDGVIYNDGTVEDLARAIGAFVEAKKLDGAA